MKAISKIEGWMKSHDKILTCIGVMILALLPFLHVNSGVEYTDTGYSLGNYENFARAEGTWALATFLANVTGWLLTKLPFGHTMLGMQVYCNALLGFLLVVVFLQLKKYLPGFYVFVGEILSWALCWCPRVILYNYMTYLFFAFGALLILKAVKEQKKKYFFFAGMMLGISLFVRFPNLTQTALIVVVIYDGMMHKEKIAEIFKRVGICIGGYLSAAFAVLGSIALFYGGKEYFLMIRNLFTMQNTDSSYSLKQMVTIPVIVCLQYMRWLWVIPVLVLLGTGIYYFCRNKVSKSIFYTFYTAGIFAVIAVFYKLGIFWRDYNNYNSFFVWAIAFMLFSLGISAYAICTKRTELFEKAYAVMVIVILLITPLGSNNALYPVFNNLFLVAPFVLSVTIKYIGKQNVRILNPLKTALCIFGTVLMVQSVLFGWVFTFRDEGFMKGIDTQITENRVLRGMRTNQERAEWIEELSRYVYDNDLCGKSVLLFGEIPFASYALEMPPALSSSWADLDTVLNFDGMRTEMEAMEGEPVVLIAADQYEDLLHDANPANQKAMLISEYMQAHSYQETFRNEKFVVYLPLGEAEEEEK